MDKKRPVTFRLENYLIDCLELLVEKGHFENKTEVLKHALRSLAHEKLTEKDYYMIVEKYLK